MEKGLCIKGRQIGTGVPKICVPITGVTYDEISRQAEKAGSLEVDIVEWRVDFYEGCMELKKVQDTLKMISDYLGDKILLFTFRSAKEGGEKAITPEAYFSLNEMAAQSGKADLIDLEFFMTEGIHAEVEKIQMMGTKVVLSNHDFQKTPEKEVIVRRLVSMQEAGADIAKIAVMPKKTKDVLVLLEASNEMKECHTKTPIITMSMGELGKISRICGEVFGSAVTFAQTGQASAPGQLPVEQMKQALMLFAGQKQ